MSDSRREKLARFGMDPRGLLDCPKCGGAVIWDRSKRYCSQWLECDWEQPRLLDFGFAEFESNQT